MKLKNGIIFQIIIITVLLLLLSYTFYRSEVFYKGELREYYNYIYIILIITLFFSIIFNFLNYKIKQYIKIFFFSGLFSLYLFEWYCTAFIPITNLGIETLILKKKIRLYKKNENKNYDARSEYDAYLDFKKKYKKIVPTMGAVVNLSNNDILPLGGISNSKTFHCNENGYYSKYESDRFGFNNPDVEWDKEKIEYLLIGDSFIHGACVNRPYDISSVLRRISGKTVINLGYGGNGPLIEYASLREYLKPNTKNVVWFFYEGNDLKNLHKEITSEILNKYLENLNYLKNLILKQIKINYLLQSIIENKINSLKSSKDLIEEKKNYEKKIKRSQFIKLFRTRELLKEIIKKKPILKNNPKSFEHWDTNKKVMDVFIKILKETNNLVQKNESNFYFVYLPSNRRYFDHTFTDNLRVKIKKITSELGITFIDIHEEIFKKKKNPKKYFPFELSGHYNKLAYSKISKEIYLQINNKKNE